MQRKFLVHITGLLLILFLFSLSSFAQTDTHQIEVGGFVTTVNLRDSVGEGPVGVGGRFAYNFTDNIALDSEIAYFPQNPSGNFGETEALVGIKAGVRREKFGAFAKVRPGIIHFGGDDFKVRYGSQSNFALDVGSVLEYYPTERTIVRFDLGDTIIPFGDQTLNSVTPPFTITPETTHNIQVSFGVGFRF